MFTDAKVIKLYLFLQLTVDNKATSLITFFLKKKVNKRLNYPLLPSIIENTIRHNIAQTTSTSKVYTLCSLAILIKGCQMKDEGRRKHQWWSLRIT